MTTPLPRPREARWHLMFPVGAISLDSTTAVSAASGAALEGRMSVRLDVGHSVKRVSVMALVLFAMGGVAPRQAAADKCKPNQMACKMNSQCCSGVCAGGMCAAVTTTSTTSTSTTTTSTTLPTVCGAGTVLVGNECQPDYGAICGTGTQAVDGQCVPDVKPAACGDGIVDAGEQCDDGNSTPGDGCFQCHIERCGNGVVDFGEECDGTANAGPYGCSSECFQIRCGNGRLDPGEECDDGNDSDDDFCLSSNADPTTCKNVQPCSVGTVPVGNECQPDYTAICGTNTQLVNGQCVPNATCPPPSCGDGIVDFDTGEACDDGNVITETQCPYGMVECTACNADCSAVLTLTGPVCNDGVTDSPEEACDDGNASCGTCSSDCRQLFQLTSATGWILAVNGASLVDGETFTLDDGMGTVATFEFDLAGDGVGAGNTTINVLASDSAALVANRILLAISNSALQIDAVRTNNLVSLVNQHQSSLGNKPIIETVSNPDFLVAGMAGGAAGDCLLGEDCRTDSDCASGLCDGVINVCVPQ
jgi:cysteine-rich repeat protein